MSEMNVKPLDNTPFEKVLSDLRPLLEAWEGTIVVNGATVHRPLLYAESLAKILRANKGNRAYIPYYNDLIELREAVNAEIKEATKPGASEIEDIRSAERDN